MFYFIFRAEDKLISRHNMLTNAFSPSSSLNRKALATDYWSTCRTICRVERGNYDKNTKRNNRYYHYLKSVTVMCKNETLDKLCNSFREKM